jgi:hypothetical protein
MVWAVLAQDAIKLLFQSDFSGVAKSPHYTVAGDRSEACCTASALETGFPKAITSGDGDMYEGDQNRSV